MSREMNRQDPTVDRCSTAERRRSVILNWVGPLVVRKVRCRRCMRPGALSPSNMSRGWNRGQARDRRGRPLSVDPPGLIASPTSSQRSPSPNSSSFGGAAKVRQGERRTGRFAIGASLSISPAVHHSATSGLRHATWPCRWGLCSSSRGLVSVWLFLAATAGTGSRTLWAHRFLDA